MDIVKMGANVLGGSKDGGGGDGPNAMMNVLKMGKSFSDMMNAKGERIKRSSFFSPLLSFNLKTRLRDLTPWLLPVIAGQVRAIWPSSFS